MSMEDLQDPLLALPDKARKATLDTTCGHSNMIGMGRMVPGAYERKL